MGVLWQTNFAIFLLVTIILAGGAGFMAGRSAAMTWRSPGLVVAYSVGLACASRFIHMALFGGTLITVHYWLVDFAVILVFGLFGFRITRVGQMTRQYSWLYERSGPLTWRAKAAADQPSN
jgi:hypothetical protein